MKEKKEDRNAKLVAIIVAHPDDESLWAGGTLLSHSFWDCFIISLCRSSDPDRAPKFTKALQLFGATGIMGDLDDGPEQTPLPEQEVEGTILKLLPARKYDLIITHNPNGEYTRHRRHEETSKAVILLWKKGKISTRTLWTFAYEDDRRGRLPKAHPQATRFFNISPQHWQFKYALITQTYGFSPESWEAQTTPKKEAFWAFNTANEAKKWLDKGGIMA